MGSNEQNETTDKEMPAFTSFVSFEQVVQILWPRKEMVGILKGAESGLASQPSNDKLVSQLLEMLQLKYWSTVSKFAQN